MSIQKPSRELTIEESISWTFDIYFKNFNLFFIPILVASLITGFFSAVISAYGLSISAILAAPPLDVADLISFVVTLLLLALALGVISWIIGTIATGICVKCTSDLLEKGSTNLENAFHFTVSKLLSLLLGVLISLILIMLGLFALIIPGIILAIMFSLVVPSIIIGNVGAIEGLSKSRKLVSHRWLKTFAFFLIVIIIVGAASLIGSLIAAPFGILDWLVNNIITSFISPIVPIAFAVYYYSMSAREQPSLPPPPPILL